MLINYDELKTHVGGNNRRQVIANLEKMRVKFLLRPDGKPITTIGAFEAALKINRKYRHTDTELNDAPQTVEL
ncbi:hypothetical protein [Thiothrix winogradskyi]|uniref:DUF4224 domain-containing protein n=1 Tax=Thiothrix winogradskyi TaxID=96472 RepID=A0ABY3T6R3_9GAMM|nr:hypothetical protein [Thiothrix winogradskyi]UJS26244.1 hypothetical protein L2Y54_09455 [Thiothrix winogradskyi]